MTSYKDIEPVLRIAAKENFVAFCYYVNYDFFKKRPFLKEIALAFQQIADGEIKTLSVSLPPRAGKSYITTLFCAWALGKYPTDSIMRNTCTATLARKLSYDAREVVKGEKFQAVFPEVKLSDDRAAVDGWSTNKGEIVSYFGQGVGGTIIGFGATKVAITDDLFKSMEDALSETVRDKTHNWKEATHDSRKESGCAEIDIGTRWVRDDVIGRNADNGYYDKQIIVPALIEKDGKEVSFCENVMTTEEYLLKKEKTSEDIWQAEYMQQPMDVRGKIFEGVKIFTDLTLIRENSEGALAYIDVADEGTDFLCMVVGHVVNKDVYVTDIVYTKANTEVTIPMCAQLLKENKVAYCRVETNNMGAMFLKALRKEKTGTQIIGVSNSTNKETRILMNSAYVLRKFHFFGAEFGDYYQFLSALKGYQKEGNNKNDDAPDAVTGLAQMFEAFMPQLDA